MGNMHYLGISKNTERINLSIRCKTQAFCIFSRNNSSHKSPMTKIVIQCIFISPIRALL